MCCAVGQKRFKSQADQQLSDLVIQKQNWFAPSANFSLSTFSLQVAIIKQELRSS